MTEIIRHPSSLVRMPSQEELRPYYGMATTFNDSNAWMDGNGGLTLGNSGLADGAADATHKYAKGDCWINVPLNTLAMGAGAGAFSRTSAGLYLFTITAAAATQIVVVPLVGILRKFSQVSGGVSNPHGVKVTDLVFGYTIATASETSIGVTFATNLDVNATARAAVVAPFGAVTYENPLGTVVATLPVAAQATPYVVRAVPAAPVFVNADNTDVFAEISFVNPGTSVAVLTHVGFHCSVALY
jgi:hypothetical protein